MKQFRLSVLTFLVVFLPVLALGSPVTLNDGTTLENLAKLSNRFGTGEASVRLGIDQVNQVLEASQSPQGSPFPALRSVWYSSTQTPSSGVYTVSADFKPAEIADERRGGVMGWLNKVEGKGIGFHVRPGGFAPGFRVSTVDFMAKTGDANESLAGLFNLDGTEARADFDSAFAQLADRNYDPSRFATFSLTFAKPSAAELAALPGATAKVTAQVFQDMDGQRREVARTIELLTNLPLPPVAVHRIGYYAYWGSVFFEGGTIGLLDNLTLEGDLVDVPPNTPPAVLIVPPPQGVKVIPPGAFSIEVGAADPDPGGEITRVELISEDTMETLATFSEPPYLFEWTDLPSGIYTISAKATDQCGGVGKSEPLTLTVNRDPRIIITNPLDGASFEDPRFINLTADVSDLDGQVILVTYKTGDQVIGSATEPPFSFTWTDIPVGRHEITADIFDQLGGQGTSSPVTIAVTSSLAPVQPPPVAISTTNDQISISWEETGRSFILESSTDLITWLAVASPSNPFVVALPAEAPVLFFRLRNEN